MEQSKKRKKSRFCILNILVKRKNVKEVTVRKVLETTQSVSVL